MVFALDFMFGWSWPVLAQFGGHLLLILSLISLGLLVLVSMGIYIGFRAWLVSTRFELYLPWFLARLVSTIHGLFQYIFTLVFRPSWSSPVEAYFGGYGFGFLA